MAQSQRHLRSLNEEFWELGGGVFIIQIMDLK